MTTNFEIPNAADAAFEDQAEPDSVDFDVLARAHFATGVISGCDVTAQGSPNMTVAVASGIVQVDGVLVEVASGNVTITAADGSLPRFDLIVVNSSGTKSAVAGTAATNAVFPAHPATSVVLAAVYVPAGDTAIGSTQIVSKAAGAFYLPHNYEQELMSWAVDGLVALATGSHRFTAEFACTLTKVRATVGTAPTGAGLRADVNRNGSSVFSGTGTQPTIAATTNTILVSTFSNGELDAGDYLTVDVDTIGSTFAGEDLVVSVWAKRSV